MDAALFANDAARAAKRSSPTGADVSQAIRTMTSASAVLGRKRHKKFDPAIATSP
jgi:hypothetical protein